MERLTTIICVYLLFVASDVQARILEVGSGKTYAQIRAALAASRSGDEIIVYPGNYREGHLVIDKAVRLTGIHFPVLDGNHAGEILTIASPDVTVSGFKLIHSGTSSVKDYAGIRILRVRNVVISGNVLYDTFFGIYGEYATSCRIENNQLTGISKTEQQSGNGIHCWKCDSMQIIGNQVTGHRDGIYFEFVTHSIIWRNYSFQNLRYGLHFMFSNTDTYAINRFDNNGAGVAVMFSSEVRMFGNSFRKNWGDAAYGILLKEISDSEIQGNYFEQNTSGIYMEGASRIHMTRNSFRDNGWGLKIQASCMDIVLEQNNFLNNTFDVGTNGSLVLNTFRNNYWDKYTGYDLNRDQTGDVPYRPVSLYSMIAEKNPPVMMLFQSLIASLMDQTEKVLPSITPESLKDESPHMKPFAL